MEIMTVLLTGFLTCLALIVAIGPQSAWLLRQGLRRDRVGLAVLCCLFGDLLLIALGTAGVGVVLEHAPWLLQVLRWAGVAYLLWFAWRSFASALRVRTGLDIHSDSTTPDAARALGISSRTLQRYVSKGVVTPEITLPSGQYRWDVAKLRAQIEALSGG